MSAITDPEYKLYLKSHLTGQLKDFNFGSLPTDANQAGARDLALMALGVLHGRTNATPWSRELLQEQISERTAGFGRAML